VEIKKINLKNFKGIRSLEVSLDGKNADVFGANQAGKTTLCDSFHWLFFGKNSVGDAEFDLKTKEGGVVIPAIDHSVEFVFDIEGRELSLKREFSEKWTKKHGGLDRILTSHETSYFIDDKGIKEKDYKSFITSVMPEEKFRMLTSPYYFSTNKGSANSHLDWKARRNLLFEIAGVNISDEDILSGNPELSELAEYYNSRVSLRSGLLAIKSPSDQLRETLQAQIKKINERLAELPIRIDEATKKLEGIDLSKKSIFAQKIKTLHTEIETLQAQKSMLENNQGVAEKRRELSQIISKMATLENAYVVEVNKKLNPLEIDLKKMDAEYSRLGDEIDRTKRKIEDIESQIETSIIAVERQRKSWHEVNNREIDITVETICPACGQALPADKIESAKAKAIELFNLARSENLEEIKNSGVRLNKEIKRSSDEVESLKGKLLDSKRKMEEVSKEAAILDEKITDLKRSAGNFVDLPSYKKLEGEKKSAELEIRKLEKGDWIEESEKLAGRIESLNIEIEQINYELAKIEVATKTAQSIEAYRAEGKTLGAEHEKLKGLLNLLDRFTEIKSRAIEGPVNVMFKLAKIKLFNRLVNGSLEDCCEVVDDTGVAFDSINGAGKVNIGLDVINVLSEYFKFWPPIFIDDASLFTDILATKAQQIRLYVAPSQKTLMISTEKE
jgi:DNA repair exonuclease SbcCD ATPase subunit